MDVFQSETEGSNTEASSSDSILRVQPFFLRKWNEAEMMNQLYLSDK
jgi:hypothetical protein